MGSTNTELVERYIAAVKFWLPEKLRDDIGAELAEDIRSEIDEIEKAKGRPLSEDEVAGILKVRGNPMAVAARYQPQRHLIGPEMFPLYIFVLKIVAVICLIPPVLAWISRGFIDSSAPVPGLASAPVNSLLVAFAIVTIVFAVIEHKGINLNKRTDWNPKSLRPVVDKNRIARSDSIGDIIGALIGIAIFVAGYLSLTTYHFPGGGSITVAPEWVPFWQFMMALAVAQIALSSVSLFKPYWSVLRIFARLLIDLAQAAAFCWLFQNHLVRGIEGWPADFAFELQFMSDKFAQYALPFFGFVAAVIILTAVWRLVRSLKPRPATA